MSNFLDSRVYPFDRPPRYNKQSYLLAYCLPGSFGNQKGKYGVLRTFFYGPCEMSRQMKNQNQRNAGHNTLQKKFPLSSLRDCLTLPATATRVRQTLRSSFVNFFCKVFNTVAASVLVFHLSCHSLTGRLNNFYPCGAKVQPHTKKSACTICPLLKTLRGQRCSGQMFLVWAFCGHCCPRDPPAQCPRPPDTLDAFHRHIFTVRIS